MRERLLEGGSSLSCKEARSLFISFSSRPPSLPHDLPPSRPPSLATFLTHALPPSLLTTSRPPSRSPSLPHDLHPCHDLTTSLTRTHKSTHARAQAHAHTCEQQQQQQQQQQRRRRQQQQQTADSGNSGSGSGQHAPVRQSPPPQSPVPANSAQRKAPREAWVGKGGRGCTLHARECARGTHHAPGAQRQASTPRRVKGGWGLRARRVKLGLGRGDGGCARAA